MSREGIIAGILALLFHGLLLFGLHFEIPPVPLAMADTAVEVSLVDGAPAAAAAPATAEPPAETPPPLVPPPPQPVPPPVPEPAPPVPEPSHETPPAAVPPPQPRPVQRREPTHPAHPSTNNTAARSAAAAQAAGPASAAVGAGGTGRSGIRPRSNPKPPYPPEAERLHQEGRVGLEVQVGADGRVISVTVTHSSGVAILDAAAVEGVRRWTFEPARVGGVAVAGRAEVPVNFSLTH